MRYPRLISYYKKNYFQYSPTSPVILMGEALVNIEVGCKQELYVKRLEAERSEEFIRWSKTSENK